jgi:uncharacterized protein YjbI with pentapeptide repeats
MSESIVTSRFRELICSPSDWNDYKNTLSKADQIIDDIILEGIRIESQDYTQIKFSRCMFIGCIFSQVDFTESTFEDVDFVKCSIKK